MNLEFIDITPIQLTEDEKVILRNLSSEYDEYEWIARDKDNSLSLFTSKPTKEDSSWNNITGHFEWLNLFNHLFQQIQWSDEEPTLTANLLEV